MYTCCPNCNTCFRITKPQLDVAQGHVRCGTCSKVFNAKQYLRNEISGKQGTKPKLPEKKVKPKASPSTRNTPKSKTPKQTKSNPSKKLAVPSSKPQQHSSKNKAENIIPKSPSPSPDIDLFDYTSISRVQDASQPSNKTDFVEQDINDIFEDLESQHALRQPKFTTKQEPQKKPDIIIPENVDTQVNEDVLDEDTAIIDISSSEDDWLKELTADVITNESDRANNSKSPQEDLTEPSTLNKPVEPEEKLPEIPTQEITTQHESNKTARYKYVDPSELLKEEKNIDEILKDMNQQLSLEINTSPDDKPVPLPNTHEFIDSPNKGASKDSSSSTDIITDESDISGMFKHAMYDSKHEPEHKPDSSKSELKDDFESSFLASLDDATLSPGSDTQKNTKSPKASPIKNDTTSEVSIKTAKPTPTVAKDDFNLDIETNLSELPGSEDEVPYQLRDDFDEDTSHRSTKIWSLYITATIALIIFAMLQLIVFRSTDLADSFPSLEPTLGSLCNSLPCRYTGPRDITQIKLLNRDIRIHPKEEKALLITATMVNRAQFKQPYPDIKITLSDLSGDVVARRQFSADKYLKRIYTPLLRMPSGQPVKIALEVIDPGRDAVNFEFTFH